MLWPSTRANSRLQPINTATLTDNRNEKQAQFRAERAVERTGRPCVRAAGNDRVVASCMRTWSDGRRWCPGVSRSAQGYCKAFAGRFLVMSEAPARDG